MSGKVERKKKDTLISTNSKKPIVKETDEMVWAIFNNALATLVERELAQLIETDDYKAAIWKNS